MFRWFCRSTILPARAFTSTLLSPRTAGHRSAGPLRGVLLATFGTVLMLGGCSLVDQHSDLDVLQEEILGDREPGPNEVLGTSIRVYDWNTNSNKVNGEATLFVVPWGQAKELWKHSLTYDPGLIDKRGIPQRTAIFTLKFEKSTIEQHGGVFTRRHDGIFSIEPIDEGKYIICLTGRTDDEQFLEQYEIDYPFLEISDPVFEIFRCATPLSLEPPDVIYTITDGRTFRCTQRFID